MIENAPEGELFDQGLKESEEDPLMKEVTLKLIFYQICLTYINEECSRRRIIWQSGEEVKKIDNDGCGQFEAKF